MKANGITKVITNWTRRVAELQAQLEVVREQLVEQEATLAERLAAVRAFEFEMRRRIGRFVERLEGLEAEVKELHKQLRRRYLDLDDLGIGWSPDDESATSGKYRYHGEKPQMPRPKLDEESSSELKRLYRHLARRFHPDFAVNEADRAYRTQMMMAINSAYATGDLARLEELANEPDAAQFSSDSEEQMARMLERELVQAEARLAEIRLSLAELAKKQSVKLMQRQARMAEQGRDYIDEMAIDLRDKIAEKTAERDMLTDELDSMDSEAAYADFMDDFEDEDFSEIGTKYSRADKFIQRDRDRFFDNEDYNPDDLESFS